MSRLSQLSDRDLVSGLDRLVTVERSQLVDVLNHLNEVERRRLHQELGYSSLFEYCVSRLRYSQSASGRRIACARVVKRFPRAGDLLRDGSINLTTLSMVAGIMTPDNVRSVLQQISGKSQREVEKMVACYRPETAVRDRVRAVVVRERVTQTTEDTRVPSNASGNAAGTEAGIPATDCRPGRGEERPGGEDAEMDATGAADVLLAAPPPTRAVHKHEIRFIAGAEFMKTLERVRALLSHRMPDASFEDVFAATMESFLETNCPERRRRRRRTREERQKGREAGTRDTSPRRDVSPGGKALPAPGVAARSHHVCDAGVNPRSRHIPDAARDAVFVRDRGRCTYVGSDGTRCRSRYRLEVDHIRPYALGGSHAVSNLRLLCRSHNQMLAERTFGW